MPAVARAAVKARAARLRAAGEAALARHLQRQVGRTVVGLVERADLGEGGVARAEDFTEIAFAGNAQVGEVVGLTVTGHDGRRVLAHAPVLEAAE